MKKNNIITRSIAAAILLSLGTACMHTDAPEFSDVPISFGIYMPRSTSGVSYASKAAPSPGAVSPGTLPENTSFGVFAFYQEGVIYSGTPARWSGSRKPNYMFNQRVDYDGSSYTYEPLRYWPANDENTISFWAYWPYEFYNQTNNNGTLQFFDPANTSNAYGVNSAGLPVAKYTVSNVPAEQYDLLFASFGNTDRTYANCTPTPGTVHFTFRHALSMVEFRIISSGDDLPANAEIIVTNMSISGVKKTASCSNPGASFESDQDAAAFWGTASNATLITLPTGSTTSTIATLILMPQALEQEGSTGHAVVQLDITYTIRFPAADPSLPDIEYADNRAVKYIWNDNGTAYGVKRWLPGRKYIYNLDAGLERIEFSEITEASWTTEWPAE